MIKFYLLIFSILILYDVLGNVVTEHRIIAETTAYRFSHYLTAGTCYCRIVGNDGRLRIVSFVVVR